MRKAKPQPQFIEGLVSEEIRRLVADAIVKRNPLSVLDCVSKVVAVYPNCGVSKRQIAEEVVDAAAAAGIAVAFSQPGQTINGGQIRGLDLS